MFSNFNVLAVRFSISLKKKTKNKQETIRRLSVTFITMNGGKSFLHHVGFIVHFTKTVLVTQDTYIMEMDRSCFFVVVFLNSCLMFSFLCMLMLIAFFIHVGLQAWPWLNGKQENSRLVLIWLRSKIELENENTDVFE